MTNSTRRLAHLATGQHGTVTRAQAHDLGLTDNQLRSRVQSGLLVRTGPNTFRSAFAGTNMLGRLHTLVLDCGTDACASGPTAAALFGFDGFRLKPPFHVTVVRGRNVQRVHHYIHTTTVLPPIDRVTMDGVPCTSATRTIIDLARHVDGPALTRALDSALRDGRTSEDFLHRRIGVLRSQGRYGIPSLLAVIEGREVTRGGHSWLERRYLELCARAGLPRPDTQVVMSRRGERIIRVDCRFPGTPVVVELLGYRWHRSRAQLDSDTVRLNALVMQRLKPVQFTYGHVTTAEQWVIEQTLKALACAAE